MYSVIVIGGRGYTGSALLPLIWRHPEFQLKAVGSRSGAGRMITDEVEGMDDCELAFMRITPKSLEEHTADVYVLALPNGQAQTWVAAIDQISGDSVIIDLSADYRFEDDWVYGQPERFEDRLRGAPRISNPGCYATGAQLALAPLLGNLESTPVVFGVSGYSGAGKTPSRKNDLEVLNDNLLPYALADHVHEREASKHLAQEIRFLPHVASFFRGITLSISAELKFGKNEDDLLSHFQAFYAGHPLVEVKADIPEVTEVRNSHKVIIGGFTVSQYMNNRIALVAVLDNLLKGAATQTVQNLNLAFNMESLTGLEQ